MRRRANEPASKAAATPAPGPGDRPADADSEQDALWAACLAEQPALLSDIANLVLETRGELIESPSIAPTTGRASRKPTRNR
jgi:hypothetical protein